MAKKTNQTFVHRVYTHIKRTDQRILVGLLVVVFILAILYIFSQFIFRSVEDSFTDSQVMEDELVLNRHPLTGEFGYESDTLPQVYSVMIDNNEGAWPQSGLDQAFLVIEAPVEAGISRMQAFFSEEVVVEKIGPVRSARPYYLDWASELDALYAHVGGSNAALDLIASGGTFDLNQYWGAQYFWRSTDRYAPHNVYTSSELMTEFVTQKQEQGRVPKRIYDTWIFKEEHPTTDEAIGVHIDFWPPVYVVDWEYDSKKNAYKRYQFNTPHTMQTGEEIFVDNIAIVFTDISIIDSVGRRDVRTLGEGEGYILQGGNLIDVVWKKPSASERLKFYHAVTGDEMAMNTGTTWVEVVSGEEYIRFIESE